MFLLIYKCRIAVSMRGKWFWKAWHCKLSLSDRLSAPADQKMPQSMMSDRQANSPGGQTLLPHFQTPERRELCGFGKGSRAHRRGRRAVSPLGPALSGRKLCAMMMADEILANLGRLTGEDHWNGDVMLCQCVALWEHGSQTLQTMCLWLNLHCKAIFPPCPFLPLQERKENKLHLLAFSIDRLAG